MWFKKTNNIYLILLIFILIFKIISYVTYNNQILSLGVPDSFTYYMPVDFLNGDVHPSRMLFYPLIIKIISIFNFEDSPIILVCIQRAISLISIYVLFKLLKRLVKNDIVVILFTISFAVNGIINEHDNSVLAESLGVSFLIFYLNSICYFVSSDGRDSIISSSLLVLILLFIKPIFITIFIIHIILMIYYAIFKHHKANKLKITLTQLIIITPLFIHANAMKKQFGYFGLSIINVNNNIGNAIISESYLESNDYDIKKHILSFDQKTNIYEIIFTMHNIKSLDEYINKMPIVYKQQAKLFINTKPNKNYSIKRLNKFVHESFFTKKHIKYIYGRALSIIMSFKKLSSIVVLYLFMTLYMLINKKKFNIFYLVVSLFSLFNILAVAVAGIGDWARLLIFSIPCYILLLANLISVIINILMDMGLLIIAKKIINKFINSFINV